MAAERLTDRDELLVADPDFLIHVVNPDTSDPLNPQGFSWKMKLSNAGGPVVNTSPVVGVTVPPGPCVIEPRVDDTVPSWITAILDTMCAMQNSITNLITLIGDSAPIGMIIIWSGSQATIPSDYRLCDGTVYPGVSNPDLRGKFVAGAGSGGSYTVNQQGGTNSVVLIESQLPIHAHQVLGVNAAVGIVISSTNTDHLHVLFGNTNGTEGAHYHSFPVARNDSGGSSPNMTRRFDGANDNNLAAGNMYTGATHAAPTTPITEGVHTHSLNPLSSYANYISQNQLYQPSFNNDPLHNHGVTGGSNYNTENKGSGNSHENRPPFWALCYIIKIQ